MSVNAHQTDSPELKNYKLDRIQNAASLCGNPETGRPTILVAGTNAKGSIVSYLSALFDAGGKRVGSYYSPHVTAREERIQINGKWISATDWEAIERKYPKAFAELTYFENATLVAWNYFRDQKVDLQILEVGMGGRLDATNLCEPDLTIIGPIGMDHAEILGNSVEKIAREKAGIMRGQKPVWIAAPEEKIILETLIREADHKSALLRISSSADSENEAKIVAAILPRGVHQSENALLAYRAYLELSENFGWRVLGIDRAIEALQESHLTGRIQILQTDPLWILDGAHNTSAVSALCLWLRAQYPQKKFEMIFGLMNDKDLAEITKMLAPFVEQVHMASFYPEREFSPLQCAQAFEAVGIKTKVYTDIPAILNSLRESGREVLVCGSFYLVGEVLR